MDVLHACKILILEIQYIDYTCFNAGKKKSLLHYKHFGGNFK